MFFQAPEFGAIKTAHGESTLPNNLEVFFHTHCEVLSPETEKHQANTARRPKQRGSRHLASSKYHPICEKSAGSQEHPTFFNCDIPMHDTETRHRFKFPYAGQCLSRNAGRGERGRQAYELW